jgi:hypothetical protein
LGDFILLLAAQPEAQRASTRVVIGIGFFFAAAAVLGVNSQSPWPARQAQALARLHELSRNMMGTVCLVCRNVKQWRNAARGAALGRRRCSFFARASRCRYLKSECSALRPPRQRYLLPEAGVGRRAHLLLCTDSCHDWERLFTGWKCQQIVCSRSSRHTSKICLAVAAFDYLNLRDPSDLVSGADGSPLLDHSSEVRHAHTPRLSRHAVSALKRTSIGPRSEQR